MATTDSGRHKALTFSELRAEDAKRRAQRKASGKPSRNSLELTRDMFIPRAADETPEAMRHMRRSDWGVLALLGLAIVAVVISALFGGCGGATPSYEPVALEFEVGGAVEVLDGFEGTADVCVDHAAIAAGSFVVRLRACYLARPNPEAEGELLHCPWLLTEVSTGGAVIARGQGTIATGETKDCAIVLDAWRLVGLDEAERD